MQTRHAKRTCKPDKCHVVILKDATPHRPGEKISMHMFCWLLWCFYTCKPGSSVLSAAVQWWLWVCDGAPQCLCSLHCLIRWVCLTHTPHSLPWWICWLENSLPEDCLLSRIILLLGQWLKSLQVNVKILWPISLTISRHIIYCIICYEDHWRTSEIQREQKNVLVQ